eukprot:scaffold67858_cov72-Phaeocystis_antarctica.AAC.1
MASSALAEHPAAHAHVPWITVGCVVPVFQFVVRLRWRTPAGGSEGPKPETQIFPRSRSLNLVLVVVSPPFLTNAIIRPKRI